MDPWRYTELFEIRIYTYEMKKKTNQSAIFLTIMDSISCVKWWPISITIFAKKKQQYNKKKWFHRNRRIFGLFLNDHQLDTDYNLTNSATLICSKAHSFACNDTNKKFVFQLFVWHFGAYNCKQKYWLINKVSEKVFVAFIFQLWPNSKVWQHRQVLLST